MAFATVIKKSLFDAAHKNTGFGEGHKCNNIHGHTFQYEVGVRAPINPDTGLSIDFGLVKNSMKKIDNLLDHKFLNEDVQYFKEVPPSAENIAIFIFNFIQKDLEGIGEVQYVRLDETPTSSVLIQKEDL